ncbi:MAG: MiaB/RimO family radical SAM methylthiotransferase, partial [Kiritimatiellae bacterium]|nr:MiaB/RimO family radical SAM methylthiotransferase [Kiritimatiellia bacterium]
DSLPDELPIERFAGHTRAFLKIQDGCDIGCSYCIVPSLRKAPRDKDPDLILKEARALAASGHKEIVVSGVSVGLYGRGRDVSLADVMRKLIGVPGIERLRLSSLHPADLGDTLCRVWPSSAKMMPHVHLPLQSGSDRILAAMRRGYTVAEFMGAVERARAALDEPAFTTDVIVGFPGETEEDFDHTLEVCRQVGFSRIHVFPYSVRPGTAAAELPGRVAADKVRERSRTLRKLGAELAQAFHEKFVGREVRVLVESCADDGTCEGHAERYFTARFAGRPEFLRQVVPVRIVGAGAEGVWGESAE